MTENYTVIGAKVGDVLTFLTGVTVQTSPGFGKVYQRGEILEVTQQILDLSKDRHGHSWLSNLADDAQLARYGQVRVAIGDFRDQIKWWQASEASRSLGRQLAREQAAADFAASDSPGLLKRYREIDEEFGKAAPTSYSNPVTRR